MQEDTQTREDDAVLREKGKYSAKNFLHDHYVRCRESRRRLTFTTAECLLADVTRSFQRTGCTFSSLSSPKKKREYLIGYCSWLLESSTVPEQISKKLKQKGVDGCISEVSSLLGDKGRLRKRRKRGVKALNTSASSVSHQSQLCRPQRSDAKLDTSSSAHNLQEDTKDLTVFQGAGVSGNPWSGSPYNPTHSPTQFSTNPYHFLLAPLAPDPRQPFSPAAYLKSSQLTQSLMPADMAMHDNTKRKAGHTFPASSSLPRAKRSKTKPTGKTPPRGTDLFDAPGAKGDLRLVDQLMDTGQGAGVVQGSMGLGTSDRGESHQGAKLNSPEEVVLDEDYSGGFSQLQRGTQPAGMPCSRNLMSLLSIDPHLKLMGEVDLQVCLKKARSNGRDDAHNFLLDPYHRKTGIEVRGYTTVDDLLIEVAQSIKHSPRFTPYILEKERINYLAEYFSEFVRNSIVPREIRKRLKQKGLDSFISVIKSLLENKGCLNQSNKRKDLTELSEKRDPEVNLTFQFSLTNGLSHKKKKTDERVEEGLDTSVSPVGPQCQSRRPQSLDAKLDVSSGAYNLQEGTKDLTVFQGAGIPGSNPWSYSSYNSTQIPTNPLPASFAPDPQQLFSPAAHLKSGQLTRSLMPAKMVKKRTQVANTQIKGAKHDGMLGARNFLYDHYKERPVITRGTLLYKFTTASNLLKQAAQSITSARNEKFSSLTLEKERRDYLGAYFLELVRNLTVLKRIRKKLKQKGAVGLILEVDSLLGNTGCLNQSNKRKGPSGLGEEIDDPQVNLTSQPSLTNDPLHKKRKTDGRAEKDLDTSASSVRHQDQLYRPQSLDAKLDTSSGAHYRQECTKVDQDLTVFEDKVIPGDLGSDDSDSITQFPTNPHLLFSAPLAPDPLRLPSPAEKFQLSQSAGSSTSVSSWSQQGLFRQHKVGLVPQTSAAHNNQLQQENASTDKSEIDFLNSDLPKTW